MPNKAVLDQALNNGLRIRYAHLRFLGMHTRMPPRILWQHRFVYCGIDCCGSFVVTGQNVQKIPTNIADEHTHPVQPVELCAQHASSTCIINQRRTRGHRVEGSGGQSRRQEGMLNRPACAACRSSSAACRRRSCRAFSASRPARARRARATVRNARCNCKPIAALQWTVQLQASCGRAWPWLV